MAEPGDRNSRSGRSQRSLRPPLPCGQCFKTHLADREVKTPVTIATTASHRTPAAAQDQHDETLAQRREGCSGARPGWEEVPQDQYSEAATRGKPGELGSGPRGGPAAYLLDSRLSSAARVHGLIEAASGDVHSAASLLPRTRQWIANDPNSGLRQTNAARECGRRRMCEARPLRTWVDVRFLRQENAATD